MPSSSDISPKSHPIIFFGNEQLAQGIEMEESIVLKSLIDNGYNVIALFIRDNEQTSRKQKISPLISLAKENNIPIYTPNKKKDLEETILPLIAKLKTPPLGVLISYNIIISKPILDAFEPYGIINIHPSRLPEGRGSTPIESAILNGDKEFWVSIMRLGEKMDAGNVFSQTPYELTGAETKQSICENLATLGAKKILELIPELLNQTAKSNEQNDSKATYTEKLTREMSALDPKNKSAEKLHNEVRAFLGFPKSKITLFGKLCTILETTVGDKSETDIDQLCADGKYLIIRRLIPENGKPMDAKSFLNGIKSQQQK